MVLILHFKIVKVYVIKVGHETLYIKTTYLPKYKKQLKKVLILGDLCGTINKNCKKSLRAIKRTAGPVRLGSVNHVRRGTEQH